METEMQGRLLDAARRFAEAETHQRAAQELYRELGPPNEAYDAEVEARKHDLLLAAVDYAEARER